MGVDADRALARRAAAQAGLFTLSDAEACMVSAKTISRRVAQELLVERQPGVFSASTAPYDVMVAERAALLSVGPRAMLSHLSAARLWGLRKETPSLPWITVPFARCLPEVWGVEVVRSRHLQGVRRTREGLAVTSPPRTVVDVGRVLDRAGVESVLAVAMQKGRASIAEIDAALVTAYRTAGTGLVRDVLLHYRPEWESVLSARFGRLTTDAGLELEPGFVLRNVDEVVAVIDFAVPELRLAFEVDGWAFHGSKAQQQADRIRDRKLLVRYGWTTIRFTTEDVLLRPDQVVAEVRALLLARAA